jgi:hypothetical protein
MYDYSLFKKNLTLFNPGENQSIISNVSDFINNKIFTCENIELIDILDHNLKIIKIKNLYITNNSVDSKNINNNEYFIFKGKNFVSTFHTHYFHFLVERMCQYEFLKQYYPDLKNIFIEAEGSDRNDRKGLEGKDFFDYLKTKNFHSKQKISHEPHKYFEDLFNIYSFDKNIYSLFEDNLFFEELYLIIDDLVWIPEYLYEKNNCPLPPWFYKEWWNEDRRHLNDYMHIDSWQKNGMIFFKKNIKQFLKKDKKYYKNIYISREDANQRYYKIINNKNEDSRKIGLQNAIKRYLPYNSNIENIFIKNNYKIINLEGMSFLEQANIFFNAEKIAGLCGSGFVNLIFCEKNTKIMEIMPTILNGGFSYGKFCEIFNLKRHFVDLINIEEIDVIENKIKSELGYFNNNV